MNKPIIRHCKNCEYNHQVVPSNLDNGVCLVKYDVILNGRWKAIFCKYYNSKYEVIGNIFDNPELMEGGEADETD